MSHDCKLLDVLFCTVERDITPIQKYESSMLRIIIHAKVKIFRRMDVD